MCVSVLTDLESLFLLLHENHQRPPFFGIFSFMMFSTEAWRQPCTYNSKLTANVTQIWPKKLKSEAENTCKPINNGHNNQNCKVKHNKQRISYYTEPQLNNQNKGSYTMAHKHRAMDAK